MKSYLYILGLYLFVFSSCSDPKTTLTDKIEQLTQELDKNQSGTGRAELAALQANFVDEFPNDSLSKSYLENISFYYLMVDSTSKAKKYASQYVAQYPDDKNTNDIALVVAKAELKEQNYLAAIKAFEKVQQNTMLSVSDTRLLGEALLAASEDDDLEDRDMYYFKHAAVLEQTQGIQASIDALAQFQTLFPKSTIGPSVMMVYADKLGSAGDLAEAENVLNIIIKQYPDSPQAATAKTMIEKDLVGLSADEQLKKILEDKSTN